MGGRIFPEITNMQLKNINPAVEEDIRLLGYSSGDLPHTGLPRDNKNWWHMASKALSVLLRHGGACKLSHQKARRNSHWIPPPRNLRCDTQGYYLWDDLIHSTLIGDWSPSECVWERPATV